MDFLTALKEEIESLEAALLADPDPRAVKLCEVRRLHDLYCKGHSPSNKEFIATVEKERVSNRHPLPMRVSGRRALPAGVRAVEAVHEFIAGRDDPTKIGDLADHIHSLGIKISGSNQKTSLSALLYRSNLFQSFGRSGWTLKGNNDLSSHPKNEVSNAFSSDGLRAVIDSPQDARLPGLEREMNEDEGSHSMRVSHTSGNHQE